MTVESGDDVHGSRAAWILTALVVSHAAAGFIFLQGVEPPPSYDPAYHFTLALDHYEFLKSLGQRPWHGVISDYQDLSGYYPPFFYTLVGLVFLVTGPSVTVARGVTLFLFLILIGATYGVGARLRSRRAGLLAAFLVSTYPICVGYSRLLYLDLPLLVMVMVAYLTLLWAGDLRSLRRAAVLGLVLALGMLTKWLFVVFFAVPVVWAAGGYLVPLSWTDVAAWVRRDRLRAFERVLVWIVLPAVAAGYFAHLLGVGRRLALGFATAYVLGALVFAVISVIRWRRELRFPPELLLLRWRNFLIALFLATLIALPWYARHYGFITAVAQFCLEQAVHPEGGIMPPTRESGLAFYLLRIEPFHLHLVYSLFLLASLWTFRNRSLRSTALALWLGSLVGFVFLSTLTLRNPRYGIPFLGYAALLTAIWIDGLGKTARRVLTALCVANGLAVYLAMTFPLPRPKVPSRELALETRWGRVIVWSERGAGNARDFAHGWEVRDISARMVERARETGRFAGPLPPVLVLANDSFFHYHAFTLYTRLLGLGLQAATFEYQNPPERVGEKVLQAQFVIEKTGSLGPDFTVKQIVAAREAIREYDLLRPDLFRLLGSWGLPDGSNARLYENLLWTDDEAFPPPADATQAVFENGLRLEAVRLRPVAAAGRHALVVWTEWSGLGSPPPGVDFFVHLRAPDGTMVGSSGCSLADGRWLPTGGSERRPRRCLLFFPRPVPAGDVSVGCGLWKPATDERLECRDSEGNPAPDNLYVLPEHIVFPPLTETAGPGD